MYTYTSRNEGIGLALIEGMRAVWGLVAVHTGAIGAVVGDRVTGILVPTGDADALAAALEPLMRNVAAATAIGERGRVRLLEKFSLDAEAARIGEVYRPLL